MLSLTDQAKTKTSKKMINCLIMKDDYPIELNLIFIIFIIFF